MIIKYYLSILPKLIFANVWNFGLCTLIEGLTLRGHRSFLFDILWLNFSSVVSVFFFLSIVSLNSKEKFIIGRPWIFRHLFGCALYNTTKYGTVCFATRPRCCLVALVGQRSEFIAFGKVAINLNS